MMLAFGFSTQITLGNIVSLVVFVALAAGAYYRVRGARSAEMEASASFWREQVEPLKDIIETQQEQVATAQKEREEQQRLRLALVTELQAEKLKTDLSGVIKQLAESHAAIVARVEVAERVGVDHMVHAVSELESKMTEAFESLAESQQAVAETMRGILHSLSDLNRKTSARP